MSPKERVGGETVRLTTELPNVKKKRELGKRTTLPSSLRSVDGMATGGLDLGNGCKRYYID